MTDMPITPAVRADLAPTGKVRAGVNYGNFILATKDAAPARANYEVFLERTLKHAKLVSVPGAEAAFDLLVKGQVDALAGLKQALLGLNAKLSGSRILDGRFMGVQQSIGVPKGKDAGL